MKRPTVAVFLVLVAWTSLAIAQPQASNARYNIYQVGGEVKAPKPISTPIPAPPDSTPRDKQLKVTISFVVAPDGSVADVKLLKRSTPDFDDYAVAAVRQWRFEPATKNGGPRRRAP